MITKKFLITGMHCTSCAINIDGELEDTDGIKSAATNYAKQTTEVAYDPAKVTDEQIIAAIKTAGYSAEVMHE
jgi:copper chaperone CopZ